MSQYRRRLNQHRKKQTRAIACTSADNEPFGPRCPDCVLFSLCPEGHARLGLLSAAALPARRT